MTDITQESLQKKQEAIDLLAKRYRGLEQRTEDIDLRLRLYFEDLLEHSSAKEETLEGSRISLSNEDGTKLVSIYPKVSGSISDAQVQAEPEKYGGATVATADMLTADKIQWSLGATIGRKFSKQFALNKQAQRVDYSAAQEPAVPSESGEDSGGGGETPGGELEG